MATCLRFFSPVLPTLPIWKAHGPDTSTAVLTYPVHDSEGEWVQPDGGDWSGYPRNPLVNWHHDVPVGRGEVTLKMIAVKGKNWVVPVGTTRFFDADSDLDGLDLRILDPRSGQPTAKSFSREQCLSRAAEAKFLVCNDHATGVSVEFLPLEKKAIQRSVVKDGYAFEHIRWKGLGWAHTYGGQQINPGAQTVSQKARPETVDLLRAGKMPDGRKFSDVVLKAFSPLLTGKPATVTSGFSRKADMDQYSEPTPDMADAPPVEAPAAAESDVPHEVSASYDVGQIVADCVEKLRQSGGKSLHKQSKKFFAKLADRWEADVEDLLAHAENTEAEAGMGSDEPDADPDDAAPADGDGPPKDDDTADDKPKKDEKAHKFAYDADGFPVNHDVHLTREAGGWLVLKSRYVPRLRLADLKPVEKSKPVPVEDPAVLTALGAEFRTLTQSIRPARRTR